MVAVKLTKRDTWLLGLLATGLLGYAYYALLVAPMWTNLQTLEAQGESLRVDLQRAKLSAQQYRKWEKETDYARQECAKLPLPVSNDLAAFLRYISAQAQTARVKVTALVPQPALPEQEFSKIPLAISLNGGFPAVLRFLDSLKEGAQVLVITESKVSPLIDSVDSKVTVDLSGFTLLEKVEVAPNAVPGPRN